jgi:hypothetical protein
MMMNQSSPVSDLSVPLSSRKGLLWVIGIFMLSVATWSQYGHGMDEYELGILVGSGIGLAALGLAWRSIQTLFTLVLLMALAGISSYAGLGNVYASADQSFFLKFLFSSQSAIMWMNVLFVLAMATYFFALWKSSEFSAKVATALTWSAVAFGLAGLGVRWRESYLINPDYGHIPVSNLYEVFVLFAIITAVLYLYYEQ